MLHGNTTVGRSQARAARRAALDRGDHAMSDDTPYDELDPGVVGLCRAINALPGVETMGSWGGRAATGAWWVSFGPELDDGPRPTLRGWLALEWLAWLIHELRDRDVWLQASAAPPWL